MSAELFDTVEDRDQDDPNEAHVVRVRNEPAEEVEAADGQTVAELNEDYPDWVPVVDVVFGDPSLSECRDETVYSYPEPRLRVINGD